MNNKGIITKDSFIDIIKEYIGNGKVDDYIYDSFIDFEIKFLADKSEETTNLSFASKIKLDLKHGLYDKINIFVKNGLFTDSTGYCHKVALNKNIVILPNTLNDYFME